MYFQTTSTHVNEMWMQVIITGYKKKKYFYILNINTIEIECFLTQKKLTQFEKEIIRHAKSVNIIMRTFKLTAPRLI